MFGGGFVFWLVVVEEDGRVRESSVSFTFSSAFSMSFSNAPFSSSDHRCAVSRIANDRSTRPKRNAQKHAKRKHKRKHNTRNTTQHKSARQQNVQRASSAPHFSLSVSLVLSLSRSPTARAQPVASTKGNSRNRNRNSSNSPPWSP